MTGPIEIELWVSSSARDTDFVARLLDVHPDGKAYNLMSPTLEVLRARYRNGEDRPELLEPGRPVKLRLANGITSNVFKAGHRIGLLRHELAPPAPRPQPQHRRRDRDRGRGRYGRSSASSTTPATLARRAPVVPTLDGRRGRFSR